MHFRMIACLIALAFSLPITAFACSHHRPAHNQCAPAVSPHHHHHQHLQARKAMQISPTGMTVQRQAGVNVYRGSGSKPDFNVIANNQALKSARAIAKASETRARLAERRARKAGKTLS